MQFKSLLGTAYTVEIYDGNYSDDPIEIIGGAEAFVTREIDDEDMYLPIRTQSGYLRFIVRDANIVNEMQPINTTDRPVILRGPNQSVCWFGFLRPEQYNQPWAPMPYEIEIPLMSVMEAMQGVKVPQAEGYVSFYSLVRLINDYVPTTIFITAPEETPVDGIFVQYNNFRELLTIAERANRGTTDKYECQSLYEVMQAFCQYFGFSLHEYGNTFFCVVYPDTNINYQDLDDQGGTQPSQWGSLPLTSMVICGANNRQNYSKMYRRIRGEFDTARSKMDEVFGIDEFFKQFSVQGAYPTGAPRNLLFNGNAEIQPYKNGSQAVAWIADSPTDSGGQIIRKPDARLNSVEREGATWYDMFLVYSQKYKAGTPESALKFNIPSYIYLNGTEYAAINIDGNVSPWYDVSQGDGFIKKLHCKFRIGPYWLKIVEQSGYLPHYEWSVTETSCYILVDDGGNLTMHGAQYTLDYRAEADIDHVSGFAIDMPSALNPGYYSVYFELLANAEPSADFGQYSSIGYLINNLAIRVLRGVNSISQPTPDFDKNVIMRNTNGMYQDDYIIGCAITSKRGVQYGAGVTLDEDHAYITTKYDEQGVIRRAAIMDKSRELINVSVRNNTQPIDSITNGGRTYGILSQSINWRDDVNDIRIINID